jgi:hypothetical protein
MGNLLSLNPNVYHLNANPEVLSRVADGDRAFFWRNWRVP